MDHPSSALQPSSPSGSLLSSQYLTDQSPAASKTRSHSIRESTPPRNLSNSSLPSLPVQPSFDDFALLYFTSELKVNDAVRVQLLVEAARGFVQKLTVPRSSYEQLWSTKSDIFEQSKIGYISRTRRLHEGRRKIKQGSKEYDCAGRFALLFLRHDIDETVASLKDITLRQGQKKATVAYERIARDLSTTVKALKSDKAHSRHYLSLLTKSGPGDLLELGDNVSNL